MSERTTGLAAWGGEEGKTTRGGLLRAGGVAALGTAGALALAGGASGARTASSGSILDKWISSKKARFGVDLSFPPLQFIDPEHQEAVRLHGRDHQPDDVRPRRHIRVRADAVRAALRRPRGEKFDMVGIAATILPSPCAFRGTSPVSPSSTSRTSSSSRRARARTPTAALEKAKFAVLQGSSQQASGSGDLPERAVQGVCERIRRGDGGLGRARRCGDLLRILDRLDPREQLDPATARRPAALRRREHVSYASRRREALALGYELAALPERRTRRWRAAGRSGSCRPRRKYHLATSLVGTERRAGLRHVLKRLQDPGARRSRPSRRQGPRVSSRRADADRVPVQLESRPRPLARVPARRLARRLDHADLVRARLRPRVAIALLRISGLRALSWPALRLRPARSAACRCSSSCTGSTSASRSSPASTFTSAAGGDHRAHRDGLRLHRPRSSAPRISSVDAGQRRGRDRARLHPPVDLPARRLPAGAADRAAAAREHR